MKNCVTSLKPDLEVFLFISGNDGVPDGIGLGVFGLNCHDSGEFGWVLIDCGLVEKLIEHRAA